MARRGAVGGESGGGGCGAVAAFGGEHLLAGDYRNLPHYASLLRKDHLFCRIVPTVEALDLAKKVGVPETHIVAAHGPYTRAFNSAVFDMLGIDVLVIRDVAVDGGLAECVIPALERQIHVMMVRGE